VVELHFLAGAKHIVQIARSVVLEPSYSQIWLTALNPSIAPVSDICVAGRDFVKDTRKTYGSPFPPDTDERIPAPRLKPRDAVQTQTARKPYSEKDITCKLW